MTNVPNTASTTDSTDANVAGRVLNWLRGGYPQGIPHSDYVALFGILHRSLTEQEVTTFAEQLAAAANDPDSTITHADIQAVISENVLENPSDTDVRRVAGRLAEGGWPLASPRAAADRLADGVG